MAKRSVKPNKTAASKKSSVKTTKKPVKKRAVKRPAEVKPKKTRKKSLQNISKPYLLAGGAGLLLLLALFGVIFSQQAAAPDGLPSLANQKNVTTGSNLPAFANYPQTGDTRVATYTLKRGKTPVLEKPDYEWKTFAHVGQWLYFYNLDKDKNDVTNHETSHTYDVYAYNTSTNQYVTIGAVKAPAGANHTELYVMDNHLYIYTSGYQTGQATYRCEISADMACGEPALFYGDKGRVYRGGTGYYALFTEGDGGAAQTTIYLLDNEGQRVKELGRYESQQYVGDNVITVDANGFIWMSTFKQVGSSAQFIRLAALDNSGLRIKELLPRNIPIQNISTSTWVDNNHILLYNDKDGYIYDTINGTFENIGQPSTDDTGLWDAEFIRRRLALTDPFQLTYAPGS